MAGARRTLLHNTWFSCRSQILLLPYIIIVFSLGAVTVILSHLATDVNHTRSVSVAVAWERAQQIRSIPALYEEDLAYCQKNNIVLDRKDFPTGHKEERPFSITNFTFANFHDVNCPSLEEALLAIKHGTRRWVNSSHETLPPLEREEYPSYFVPDGCDIPFLSPHHMCQTLNKYSHIIIHGDSLTRHMRKGLLIVLRRDLVLGGILSKNKYGERNPYNCRCDGQFSEEMMCRQNNDIFFNNFTPRDLGVCSHLPEFNQFRLMNPNWDLIDCSDPNYKGAIYMIQGGAHFETNATKTLIELIDPIFNHPTFRTCLELGKLRVVWVSYGSQSRQLDTQYPLQTRENAFIFNQEMEIELKKRLEDIVIIDWWRLTAEAQTSDGLHSLTDINVMKANHLINILSYLE